MSVKTVNETHKLTVTHCTSCTYPYADTQFTSKIKIKRKYVSFNQMTKRNKHADTYLILCKLT